MKWSASYQIANVELDVAADFLLKTLYLDRL